MSEVIVEKCFACEHFSGMAQDEDQDMNVICSYWHEKTFRIILNNEPVVCPKENTSHKRI